MLQKVFKSIRREALQDEKSKNELSVGHNPLQIAFN